MISGSIDHWIGIFLKYPSHQKELSKCKMHSFFLLKKKTCVAYDERKLATLIQFNHCESTKCEFSMNIFRILQLVSLNWFSLCQNPNPTLTGIT